MTLITWTVGSGLACAGPGAMRGGAAGGADLLAGNVAPVHYNLALRVDPREERFSGRVRISVKLAGPTRFVRLHAQGLTIERAFARSRRRLIEATPSFSRAPGDEEPSLLTLSFERELPAGRALIEVAYRASFHPRLAGLYRVRDGGSWYAFTQFEPTDARRAFPCFDEPRWKVPFDLSLTVPRGDLAVANSPEASRDDDPGSATTTFRFAKTKPLPTYLVAFAVGPLEVLEGARAPVPIRLVAARGKARLGGLALEVTEAMLSRLIDYFGSPYPYEKLDIVAAPEFAYGAMENAGLIVFREELLLADPRRMSEEDRRSMVATIAHEVAHQWFGNWVTMRWWDDLWLNESFATWITPKVVDAWRPAYRLSLEGVRDKAAAMEVDALAAARKIRQPVQSSSEASEAFDRITYEKGAAVLAMIESWIGPERFQKGVRRYLRRHAWRHATARDLLRALARAGRADVGAVAESFLDQPGLPLVSLEPACESGRLTLRLRQRPFAPKGGGRAAGADGARWRVPVCVRLVAEGAPAETLCALVGADGAEVEREVRRCPVAIVPNALERGYYRWQLPPEWMARLRSAPLEVAERAGVVANAVALLEAGEAPVDAVLDELVGYAADPDWIVVERVVDALEKVNDALVDEVGRPGFREVVRRALGGTAERLGWKPRAKEDADTRLLRAKVLWAMGGLAEDPRALAEAERIASAYLRDRASVDPDLAPVAALLASRRGDERRLEAWAAIVESAKLPSERLVGLRGLAGFTRPDLARRALDLTLTDKVRQQDVVRVVEKMLAHHATREIAYAWLKERFEDLRRKVPEVRLAGVYTSFGKLGSAALRADAAAFFGAPARRLEGGERRLAEGLELLDVALALRAREGERARAYFERAAGK